MIIFTTYFIPILTNLCRRIVGIPGRILLLKYNQNNVTHIFGFRWDLTIYISLSNVLQLG